jgi:hypothetical protein
MALAYLTGTATQGSADAFVEAEIATALAGQNARAMRVREILFELPRLVPLNATIVEVSVAISRRAQTALPNVTDRNVIAKVSRQIVTLTSGVAMQELVHRVTFAEDDEVLLVEDPIYLDVDSTGTSASNVVRFRLGYELVNINANDRLQLALQSLNDA